MAAIYCEEHGRSFYEAMKSNKDEVTESNKDDSEEGEFTKVVIGPIEADGCLCNQCNARIKPGDTAVYVSHYNKWYPDNHGEYEYMDMGRKTEKKVYTIKSKLS